jgi:DNA-binding transcriptional LysR family regulator
MRGGTDGKVEGGKLDFLVEPALAVDPTAALVSEVRRRVANIQIRLRRGEGSSNQLQKLREGVSQFGIVYDIPPHPELATLPLGRHALWVVFPPGSDLEDGEGLTVEKLDGVSMVGVPRGAAQREFLDDVLRRSGVRTRMVVETDIRAQLIPLVLSGVGATIVPEAKALEAAMRGAVARKLFPSVGRTFELVWISEEVTPEMECVIGIAREMVESGKLGGGEVRDVLGECPSGGEESGTVSGLY